MELTLCSQPVPNRLVESFPRLFQSLYSLVMVIALCKFLVPTHGGITHEPLN